MTDAQTEAAIMEAHPDFARNLGRINRAYEDFERDRSAFMSVWKARGMID